MTRRSSNTEDRIVERVDEVATEMGTMAAKGELPHYYPDWIPPLLPALYAWQIHGIEWAIGVYVIVRILLFVLGPLFNWLVFMRGWSIRSYGWTRIGLIAFSFIMIGRVRGTTWGARCSDTS